MLWGEGGHPDSFGCFFLIEEIVLWLGYCRLSYHRKSRVEHRIIRRQAGSKKGCCHWGHNKSHFYQSWRKWIIPSSHYPFFTQRKDGFKKRKIALVTYEKGLKGIKTATAPFCTKCFKPCINIPSSIQVGITWIFLIKALISEVS